MFKALVDLRDRFFKPINALVSRLFGGGLFEGHATGALPGGSMALPPQGGSLFEGHPTGNLVDKLEQHICVGAPTPLTPIRLPTSRLSALFASQPILLAANEAQKPSWADVREV